MLAVFRPYHKIAFHVFTDLTPSRFLLGITTSTYRNTNATFFATHDATSLFADHLPNICKDRICEPNAVCSVRQYNVAAELS